MSGTLSKLEFEEFIAKLGVFLKKQELTTVYTNFDKNQDGQICYEEFINALRVSFVPFKAYENEQTLIYFRLIWSTRE